MHEECLAALNPFWFNFSRVTTRSRSVEFPSLICFVLLLLLHSSRLLSVVRHMHRWIDQRVHLLYDEGGADICVAM